MRTVEAAVAQIRPEVAELRAGQRFEARFACLAKERLTARTGSSYLSLRLRDRSGTITGRVFRDADRIGLRFDAGDAILVRGKVERFGGELNAELDDVRRLEPGRLRPRGVPARGLPLGRGAGGVPRAPRPRGSRPGRCARWSKRW